MQQPELTPHFRRKYSGARIIDYRLSSNPRYPAIWPVIEAMKAPISGHKWPVLKAISGHFCRILRRPAIEATGSLMVNLDDSITYRPVIGVLLYTKYDSYRAQRYGPAMEFTYMFTQVIEAFFILLNLKFVGFYFVITIL